VKALYEKLGISSIPELEYACVENRLIELEGFGQKSQEKILKAIEHFKKTADMFLYSFASEHAERLLSEIQNLKSVIRVSLVGSLRRRNEIVKDIDILVSTRERDREIKLFVLSHLLQKWTELSPALILLHMWY